MRKILVLTGKRGGYGAMLPMLRKMRDASDIELQLVVTDQHVSSQFGNTIREIEREFKIAAAVDMQQASDSNVARALALGTCLSGMARALETLDPDICVLYGDRGEVLATAIAASHLQIPIAHLQGGDVSGSLDEPMRHAVTKLSHLHFPSTEASAERLRRMGEEEHRIFVVGDNHLDLIAAGEYSSPDEVQRKLGLDPSRPIVVVLQHSETTAPDASFEQMRETLLAVRSTGHQAVVVHPCSDAGYQGILDAVHQFALPPQFSVHVNLDAQTFWGLLAIASVFVGNSSAGLIETPSFHIPAVNVGRRQEGRLFSENVLHVGHDRVAIQNAITHALEDSAFRSLVRTCTQLYGDGHAGDRVVEVLRTITLDQSLLVKRMTY